MGAPVFEVLFNYVDFHVMDRHFASPDLALIERARYSIPTRSHSL